MGLWNSKTATDPEAERHAVAKFGMASFTRGSRVKGVRELLGHPEASDVFFRFLAEEDAAINAEFLQDMEEIRAINDDAIKHIGNDISSLFTSRSRNRASARKQMGQMCDETKLLMAARAFPRFVESDTYKKWQQRRGESSVSQSVQSISNLSFLSLKADNMLDRAISSIDPMELEYMMKGSSRWMRSTLSNVEAVPVCVAIATARKGRPGFPLVYVNACFEYITGYPRSEIIGQNCKFLQTAVSEKDSIARIREALKSAKPVKVAITNFRKNGEPFKNLLAMKPIFDAKGEYIYVLSTLFDVTQEDATPAKLMLADDLLRIVPDRIDGVNISEKSSFFSSRRKLPRSGESKTPAG